MLLVKKKRKKNEVTIFCLTGIIRVPHLNFANVVPDIILNDFHSKLIGNTHKYPVFVLIWIFS